MNPKSPSTRNGVIDIMKGVMIISIVLYHLIYRVQDGIGDRILCGFVYLFIPLFFLLTGYFYRKKDGSLIPAIIRRMKALILPAVLTVGVLLLLFGPYYLAFHEEYSVSVWLGDILTTYLRPQLMLLIAPNGSVGLLYHNLSPVWFIWTMGFASLIFYPIAGLLYDSTKKLCIAAGVLVVTGAILYALVPELSWSLQLAPLYAGIMLIGAILGKHKVIDKLCTVGARLSIFITIAAFAIHIPIYGFTGTDLLYIGRLQQGDLTSFVSGLIFPVQTLIGGYVILSLARLINALPKISGLLEWIGRHTMVILLFHCLIGGIACDMMHTFNRPGPEWYHSPVTSDMYIKSVISAVISLPLCCGLAQLNDRLKMKVAKK